MNRCGPTRRLLRRIPVGLANATVALAASSPLAAHGDDDEPANPNYSNEDRYGDAEMDPGGFAALAGAAMLVMLLFDSGTRADLSSPQLATTLPDSVARGIVAASYVVVAPAFLAAAFAGHWYVRTQHADPDTSPDVIAPSTAPVAAP